MKKNLTAVLILTALLITGCSASSDYRTFEEQVQEVIVDMISLMDRGLYSDMVNEYFEPDFIKQYGAANVVSQFELERTNEFYLTLKTCQQILPTVQRSSLLVTFSSENFDKSVNFQKLFGKWYYLPERR